jgi:hypothetical protein
MEWSIVSKAAERSSRVRREMLPESVERRRSFRMCRRAVSVL